MSRAQLMIQGPVCIFLLFESYFLRIEKHLDVWVLFELCQVNFQFENYEDSYTLCVMLKRAKIKFEQMFAI